MEKYEITENQEMELLVKLNNSTMSEAITMEYEPNPAPSILEIVKEVRKTIKSQSVTNE